MWQGKSSVASRRVLGAAITLAGAIALGGCGSPTSLGKASLPHKGASFAKRDAPKRPLTQKRAPTEIITSTQKGALGLAVAGTTRILRTLAPWQPGGGVGAWALSPNQLNVLVGVGQGTCPPALEVMSLANPTRRSAVPGVSYAQGAAFAPDSSVFAVAGANCPWTPTSTTAIIIVAGRSRVTLEAHLASFSLSQWGGPGGDYLIGSSVVPEPGTPAIRVPGVIMKFPVAVVELNRLHNMIIATATPKAPEAGCWLASPSLEPGTGLLAVVQDCPGNFGPSIGSSESWSSTKILLWNLARGAIQRQFAAIPAGYQVGSVQFDPSGTELFYSAVPVIGRATAITSPRTFQVSRGVTRLVPAGVFEIGVWLTP